MLKTHVRKFLNLEILFLTGCLIFFIMIFSATFEMEIVSTYRLPRVLSGFGIVVTLGIFISKLSQIHARAMELKAARKAFEGANCFLIMFVSALYFFSMQYLGFLLATGCAIFGFSLLMHYQNKRISLAAAVALSFIIYFIFVTLLKVSLPAGPIERLFI